MFNRRRTLARQHLDRRFSALPATDVAAGSKRTWIKSIRDALGMTGRQLASRMGITPQSLSELERSEALGTIRMSTLRRAAEALDCDLVYDFVPRRPLEETVNQRARALARRQLDDVARTMALENQGISEGYFEDRVANHIRDYIREADLWNDN